MELKLFVILLMFVFMKKSLQSFEKCFSYVGNQALFNFIKLQESKDTIIQFSDENNNNFKLVFSFCTPAQYTCLNKKSNAILVYLDQNLQEISCVHLSPQIDNIDFQNLFSSQQFGNIISNDQIVGVQLTQYNIQDKQYGIQYNIMCNENQQNNNINTYQTSIINNTFVKLDISSQSGCPVFQIQKLFKFLHDTPLFMLLIFWVIGIFYCFFGVKYLKQTLSLTGFLIALFILLPFGFELLGIGSIKSPQFHLFFILFSIIIAIVAGYYSYQYPPIGLGIVCIQFAITLTFVICQILIYIIPISPKILFWILFIVLCVILIYLSSKYWDKIFVIGGSAFGAYLIMRGLSFVIGQFPSEQEILALTSHYKDFLSKSFLYYLYIVLFFILWVFGARYQFKTLQAFKEQLDSKEKQVLTGISSQYQNLNFPKFQDLNLSKLKNFKNNIKVPFLVKSQQKDQEQNQKEMVNIQS